MKISKAQLKKLIVEETKKKLNEDETIDKPGGQWTQPGVTGSGDQADESITGTNAEIVASILDLLADYEIGLDGAREVVHDLAAELGLVPADEQEPEPEARQIGFVREALRKKLLEESFKRALTNALKK